MPKQKIELSNEQKNIAKRFLLCNLPTCTKDDGQTAIATRLCPFCYKVGYCCPQCMNKDMSRHYESDCQKNLNSAQISDKNDVRVPVRMQQSDDIKSKKTLSKNGIMRVDTVNVNDYLSGSESSCTDEEKEQYVKQKKPQNISKKKSKSKK
jgi:hypothetical protein